MCVCIRACVFACVCVCVFVYMRACFLFSYMSYLPPIVVLPSYRTKTDSATIHRDISNDNKLPEAIINPQLPLSEGDSERWLPHQAPATASFVVSTTKLSVMERLALIFQHDWLGVLFVFLVMLVPCNVLCQLPCIRMYLRRLQRNEDLGQRFKLAPALGEHDLTGTTATLRGSAGKEVECMASHGSIVASCSMDGDIHLWDVVTGKTLSMLTAMTSNDEASSTSVLSSSESRDNADLLDAQPVASSYATSTETEASGTY